MYEYESDGPGGAGAPTHWQCAATLHRRAFFILSLPTEMPIGLKRQLPLYLSASQPCPLPPASLPPLAPALCQLRQLKITAWGRGYDQCKQSTHYLHHKNRVDISKYTPSFPIPSALIHGDLWGSFIVLDREDLELLEHIGKSLSQLMVTQA